MHMTMPTPDELREMLLEMKGIAEDEKEAFLNPSYEIGDVFHFEDMQKAVERIYEGVKGGEQIGIYADYDCDGIPGAVIMSDFFEKLGAQERIHIYIPNRHDEGYGLSTAGIDILAQKGVTLIITVDLGITALAEVADARSRGIDVIITDHHAPIGETTPEFPAAYAIVHSAKSSYRNPDPCGAAVAFYLVCGFLQTYGKEFGVAKGWEKWLLDMVGFATLSDMVLLTGENRMLVRFGILVMKKMHRLGLRTLLLQNNIFIKNLTEQDLTFTIAPRINAASRMDTPMLAFELLKTKDIAIAETLARKLEEVNNERKLLVARIVKDAHKSLSARELPAIVVIGNTDWRPAVLGLVATKLSETYMRSFFVWGNGGDGTIKGSCRMIETHHAAYLMQKLPEGTLLHGGGHQAAGGFAVAKEQVHFLEDALNAVIIDSKTNKRSQQEELTSIALPLACVTDRHLTAVRTLAPFGVGNVQPLFHFQQTIIKNVKMFGKTKEHLELTLGDTTGTATAFMFFAPKAVCEKCVEGAMLSLLGTLESGFRGGARIRIQEIN